MIIPRQSQLEIFNLIHKIFLRFRHEILKIHEEEENIRCHSNVLVTERDGVRQKLILKELNSKNICIYLI